MSHTKTFSAARACKTKDDQTADRKARTQRDRKRTKNDRHTDTETRTPPFATKARTKRREPSYTENEQQTEQQTYKTRQQETAKRANNGQTENVPKNVLVVVFCTKRIPIPSPRAGPPISLRMAGATEFLIAVCCLSRTLHRCALRASASVGRPGFSSPNGRRGEYWLLLKQTDGAKITKSDCAPMR